MAEITYGDRISFCRRMSGLSQRELAILAGVNEGFLSDVERTHAHMTVPRLQRLALALGVSCATLLGEAPFPDRIATPGKEKIS